MKKKHLVIFTLILIIIGLGFSSCKSIETANTEDELLTEDSIIVSREMQQLIEGMKMMMKRGFAVTFDGTMDPVTLRTVIQAAQENMYVEPSVTIESEKFGNVDAELLVPENSRDDAVVVYVHGGGLITGNAFSSRGYASMLAVATELPVYTFSYRLAPEDPFPAGVDDCFLAYKHIVEENPDKPIFLLGESGGAYLSIVTAMKARDEGIQMPAGVIPYSPVIDQSGTIVRDREDCDDFTVTAEGLIWLSDLYIPNAYDRTNVYASPYFDDMHDMPPMLLAWNTTETLAIDSEILVEKLKAQGIEYKAKDYPGTFHAFATAGTGTPESLEVLEDTVEFINSHIK